MTEIIILGAGGHAQVAADILILNGKSDSSLRVKGYLDDNGELHGQEFLDLPVLGALGDLTGIPHDGVLIAIGDNRIRARIFQDLLRQGETLVSAVHPAAVIADNVTLGRGVLVCAGVIINPGASIGDNVILNTGCRVDHHNSISSHVHIGPGCTLGGDVRVGEGSLVGIGATVMPQRSIGEWCTIGAAALVTKDIPAHSTALGIPASFGKGG